MILTALALAAALTGPPSTCAVLSTELRDLRLISSVDASDAPVLTDGQLRTDILDDGREYSVSAPLRCVGGPDPVRVVELNGSDLGYVDARVFTPIHFVFDRVVVGGPGGAVVRDRASSEGRVLTRFTSADQYTVSSQAVAGGPWLSVALVSGESGYVRASEVVDVPSPAPVTPNTGFFIAFSALNALGALVFLRRFTTV